jgi:tetratricopeptide (TPR) repeat protein
MALPGWSALQDAGPWRWVLAAGLAVLLLGGTAFAGWSWYSAGRERALAELSLAIVAAREAQAPQAPASQREAAAARLEEVIARHSGRTLVAEAAYHLGSLRFDLGAHEAARGAYSLALLRGARGSLAALSRLGIAYTWEAEGKFPEAARAYREALAGLTTADFLYEETLFGLARATELAGHLEEARETYRRLLREVPASARAETVRWRLAVLEGPPKQ